jgi:hypothetical protein
MSPDRIGVLTHLGELDALLGLELRRGLLVVRCKADESAPTSYTVSQRQWASWIHSSSFRATWHRE